MQQERTATEGKQELMDLHHPSITTVPERRGCLHIASRELQTLAYSDSIFHIFGDPLSTEKRKI